MEYLPKIQSGKRFTVYAVAPSTGKRSLFKEFFCKCPLKAQKKLHKAIIRLADQGPHPSKEKCRAIGNGFFELKEGAYRIVFFYFGRDVVVITHGFEKHGGPPIEVEKDRAKTLRAAIHERYGSSLDRA